MLIMVIHLLIFIWAWNPSLRGSSLRLAYWPLLVHETLIVSMCHMHWFGDGNPNFLRRSVGSFCLASYHFPSIILDYMVIGLCSYKIVLDSLLMVHPWAQIHNAFIHLLMVDSLVHDTLMIRWFLVHYGIHRSWLHSHPWLFPFLIH